MTEITVEQCDREAAAAYWKVSRIGNSETQRRYLSGEADNALIVQAFARHRTQYGAQSDWQPMETAPKDGTVIDVWRDGHRDTVYWGYPPHCCGEMGQYCDSDWHGLKEQGWICATFGEYVGRSHNPFTHWMPLPEPPAIERGEHVGGGDAD